MEQGLIFIRDDEGFLGESADLCNRRHGNIKSGMAGATFDLLNLANCKGFYTNFHGFP